MSLCSVYLNLLSVLIKPSLHNNIITVADYCYNYLAKQHILALLGHHQAYKTVVLVKVHSVVFLFLVICKRRDPIGKRKPLHVP